jgi:hypothetical protein
VFDLYLNGGEIAQFMVDGVSDECHEAEKRCFAALMVYGDWRQKCSPVEQMRCAEVFKRWARSMHIDEALSLS